MHESINGRSIQDELADLSGTKRRADYEVCDISFTKNKVIIAKEAIKRLPEKERHVLSLILAKIAEVRYE